MIATGPGGIVDDTPPSERPPLMTGKTYLNVPFPEKDRAKALGARWDPVERKWFTSSEDLGPFARWLPDGQTVTAPAKAEEMILPASVSEDRATYRVTRETEDAARPRATLSLTELLITIQGTIEAVFPQPLWVRVEVNQAKQRNGHWFLELVEHDAGGQVTAEVSGTIWKSSESMVQAFQSQTGVALAAGIKLLVAARPRFNPRYGLKLDIIALDAAFTLGDMAAKLQQIRETLRREGVFDRNRQLRLPGDFFRVAVISPAGAASLGDFQAESRRLEAAGLCRFHHEETAFQGTMAPAAIREALNRILQQHAETPFDAIAIIRGGGSAADLFWLNDESLARAVCLCPLPVITGIGHEPDNTILDEVACRRCDTPSKVAQLLLTSIADTAQRANDAMTSLRQQALHRLAQAERQLTHARQITQSHAGLRLTLAERRVEEHGRRLRDAVRTRMLLIDSRLHFLRDRIRQGGLLRLDEADRRLDERRKAIGDYARQRLDGAENECRHRISFILALGPEKTLRRGYAILRVGERVVTRSDHIPPGAEFQVTMQDANFFARKSS